MNKQERQKRLDYLFRVADQVERDKVCTVDDRKAALFFLGPGEVREGLCLLAAADLLDIVHEDGRALGRRAPADQPSVHLKLELAPVRLLVGLLAVLDHGRARKGLALVKGLLGHRAARHGLNCGFVRCEQVQH